jgi:hypothetical protein
MPLIFSSAALAIITAVFLARTPRALRRRFLGNPRQPLPPAWVATAYAIVGLLTLGLVWPATTLDQALPLVGGRNYLNLVEAMSATAGFWYLRDAIRLWSGDREPGQLRYLLLMWAAQAACFIAIPHREGPMETFIDDHLASVACWMYMSVYMLGVLWLSFSTLTSALPRRAATAARLFILGSSLVMAAAIVDLAYSATGHFAGKLTPAGAALFVTFGLLFYPGMLAIMVGYLLAGVSRTLWRYQGWQLERMVGPSNTRGLIRRRIQDPDPLEHAYGLTIEIQNRLMREALQLTPGESRRFRRTERWIARTTLDPSGRTWKA